MQQYTEANYEYGREPYSSNNIEKKKKTKEKAKRTRGRADGYVIFLIFALVTIGLVMILSSSFYRAIDTKGDGYYYFSRQLKWAVLGFVAMIVAMNVNYKIVKKLSLFGYGVSLLLLLAVFIIGVGTKGAVRWLPLGPISFQPSEIAKIAIIATIARCLSMRQTPCNEEDVGLKTYMKEIAFLLIPVTMIVIENISTAIVLLATGAIMLGISGFRLERWIIGIGIPLFVAFIIFIEAGGVSLIEGFAGGKYAKRFARFEVWLDPWSSPTDGGYQVIQSLYAIGSGGFMGVGLGKSKQKLGYLPEAHNDIIFAIICEEFGLMGATLLLGLFITLIVRTIWIATHAPDKFSMYFAMGMVTLIAIQVIINVCVVTNITPTTGMPLPFISYGGTSLLFTMAGMGVVLNISRYTNDEEKIYIQVAQENGIAADNAKNFSKR